MSLNKISNQLLTHQTENIPPVELWNPAYCGEIDMQIKANGEWFYNGTPIPRIAMVKLFSSVLLKEDKDGESSYFLVTPVEKVKIIVEDAPFVITQWCWLKKAEEQGNEEGIMRVSTNLGGEFLLNAEHPLTINKQGELYVTVRRNLLAKVHRNVYYQWVDMAQEQQTEQGIKLVLNSAGCQFCLGYV